jgi:hypothetical protein
MLRSLEGPSGWMRPLKHPSSQSMSRKIGGGGGGGRYLAVHDDLVVDAELALRHPGEVALHHHLPCHVGGQNLHIKLLIHERVLKKTVLVTYLGRKLKMAFKLRSTSKT